MSKQMTPCEKLGYKVGDKFTVIKDSYFEKGTIVALSEDDGSEVPWFTCGGVRRALIIGGDPDVEPTPSKLKPAKQALADAIHQNGGWREYSTYACQHKINRRIVFTTSQEKPKCDVKNWLWAGDFVFWFNADKVLPNWHQTVLSREEYYQAYPVSDADGWIEWKGGKCPVEKGLMVDIRVRDGREERNLAANTLTKGRVPDASWAFWKNDGMAGDIIAYRPHKPEVKPELCESVMRSIQEHESIDGSCAKVTEENKHQHVDANPTIEQLAHDYRNKLDFANRKQDEADKANMDSDAALSQLEDAIAAIGFAITPLAATEKDPELVITDWRDLRVGDVIRCIGDWQGEDTHGVELSVDDVECPGYGGRLPISVILGNGDGAWGSDFEFIRRP